MTRDNVERVRKVICGIYGGTVCETPCIDCRREARAAMAATLELAAEDLRAEAKEWDAQGMPKSASRLLANADWLLSRANELKEKDNG